MFLFLCVFGGLARYDQRSRWSNSEMKENMNNPMRTL
jgi:hypothetical protein